MSRRRLSIAFVAMLVLLSGCSGFVTTPSDPGRDSPSGKEETVNTATPTTTPVPLPDDLYTTHNESLTETDSYAVTVERSAENESREITVSQAYKVDAQQSKAIENVRIDLGEREFTSRTFTNTSGTITQTTVNGSTTQTVYTPPYESPSPAVTTQTVHERVGLQSAVQAVEWEYMRTTTQDDTEVNMYSGADTDLVQLGEVFSRQYTEDVTVETTMRVTKDGQIQHLELTVEEGTRTEQYQYTLSDVDSTTVPVPEWTDSGSA